MERTARRRRSSHGVNGPTKRCGVCKHRRTIKGQGACPETTLISLKIVKPAPKRQAACGKFVKK